MTQNHAARPVIDARAYPPLITTAAALDVVQSRAVATARTSARPVRVLPFRAPARRSVRLALVIAAGSVTDAAVLGTAGWLFGVSATGRALGAALVVLALLGGGLLLAAGTGRVHCPGCPR